MTPQTPPNHAIVLSAGSAAQLAAHAAQLRDRLAELSVQSPDVFASVAYTLQVGRTPMPHRLGIVTSGLAEAGAALDAYLAHRSHPALIAATAGAAPSNLATEEAAAHAWLNGSDVDWKRYWPSPPARIWLPSRPWRSTPAPQADAPADAAPPVLTAPETAPDPAAAQEAVRYLTEQYAEISGLSPHQVDAHVPLDELGLSSFLVTRLNQRLMADLGETDGTLFFSHPTLAAVAAALAARYPRHWRASPAATVASPPPQVDDLRDDAIAIVGMAGRFPKSPNLDAFWDNLSQGRDCITAYPASRARPGWPTDIMWGGFLDGVDLFDPLLFQLTPRDADLMDPQERIFLEVVWEALEDAGYTRARLREQHRSRVAVYAGSMHNEYPYFGVEQSQPGSRQDSGATLGGIANRVSYLLDLHGPSMTVDTMCSSSITATHLAVRALRSGESEVAIVGAVNLSLHPNKFVQIRRMKLDSSDNRCRSFGLGGDGFVPAEGAGVVVLKALRRAIADGDRIHAVLRGTAVVHAGRTNGYLVPNPDAQGEMVQRALADAAVDPATIGYVEAHGAGTALGDPVEIKGLLHAFGGLPVGSIRIGSVKSVIGHVEPAAGIAALIKVVLQLRHGMLAPSLHAEQLNPNIAWDSVPFQVQQRLSPWPATGTPRRAGISSFGAGGTIAHAVVEEHVSREIRPACEPRPQLVVLSAYDGERLRELTTRIIGYLDRALEGGQTVDLDDLAYTLQIGREPLRERLAVVAQSVTQLRDELRAHAEGRPSAVVTGRAPRAAAESDVAQGSLTELAQRWVAGDAVRWTDLHEGARRPRIVSLPHYPFARVRCWLPEPEPAGPRAEHAETPLYERTWTPAGPIAPPALPGTAVVCVFSEHSEHVARELAAMDGRFVLVREGADIADGIAGFLTETDAQRLVDQLLAELPELAGWLDLADLYRPDRERGLWQARLAGLRRLVSAKSPGRLRVLQMASGLQADAEPPGLAASMAAARMAGFVRVLGAESRRLAATVLDTDVPSGQPGRLAAQVLGEWGAIDGYGEVCHRGGQRLRPALRPLEATHRRWQPDLAGTYVVTGGTRGLGALVVRFLAERGARHLAVLGRQRADESAFDYLRERGVTVAIHSGQLTDRVALGSFLDRVRAQLGPIRGVVHCAGASGQVSAFASKESAQIRAVLEPKADGIDALASLTEGDRLEFFTAFSSICAAVPAVAAGVSDYAAANSYLDFAVAQRVRAGQTWYRSVNWPQWSQTGGGVGKPNPSSPVGVAALDDAAGLRVLERVLCLPTGTRVLPLPPLAAAVDLDAVLALRPNTSSNGATPSAPVPAVPYQGFASAAPAPKVEASTLPEQASTATPPGGTRPARWLADIFGEALRISPDALDPTVTFGDLGVESIMLGELLRAIERHLDRHLEPTTLLDNPTLEQLSTHLGADEPTGPVTDPRPSPEETVSAPQIAVTAAAVPAQPVDNSIAVIGVACRMPGAPDADTFWRNLVDGVCSVTEAPLSRWDHRAHYDPQPRLGSTISKWGGFVDGIEDFDPGYFNLSDSEGVALDPAIRMFLEAAATCVRDAGYADGELAGQRVGVFAGARLSDYGRRVALASSVLRSDQNFIAAHVAHHFDFRGPNLVVDSACSSSLVSVQLAVRSLLAGESVVALAGGVEVLLDEQPYIDLSAARALSPSGLCHTFDERADGFVPAEGCGVVLLKPLRAALADGDRIYAVIQSVAVNNDGRTMGITTPNPAAQADVVRSALAAAGRRPSEVGMVEAHGTGTLIGDPIELRALTNVFAGQEKQGQWCAIGSVKSNVGHLLSAAGMAGLLKTVLSLDRGVIPATLHCDRPNPRFDFGASPFYVNTVARSWDTPPAQRVAGVSSFGLGGTNAHLIASGFDPAWRAGHPAARQKLPAPVFQRRRLWLENVAPQAPVRVSAGTPDAVMPAGGRAAGATDNAASSPPDRGNGQAQPAGRRGSGVNTSILDLEISTLAR